MLRLTGCTVEGKGVGDVREEVRVGVEGGSLPLGSTGVG